jgi:hypothetical protein
MKTILFASLALVGAMAVATAEEKKADKTFGEKTADTLQKAGEKTKDAGRALVDSTKKAGEAVVDAVTPDKDARKVEVTLAEHRIEMPKSVDPGKTAFVVHNAGKEKHNFEIQGQGIHKKFMTSLSPDESKVLHVDLTPGNYKGYLSGRRS